jgi:hypothetical protein
LQNISNCGGTSAVVHKPPSRRRATSKGENRRKKIKIQQESLTARPILGHVATHFATLADSDPDEAFSCGNWDAYHLGALRRPKRRAEQHAQPMSKQAVIATPLSEIDTRGLGPLLGKQPFNRHFRTGRHVKFRLQRRDDCWRNAGSGPSVTATGCKTPIIAVASPVRLSEFVPAHGHMVGRDRSQSK